MKIAKIIKKYLKWGLTFIGISLVLFVVQLLISILPKDEFIIAINIVKAIFSTLESTWYFINLPIVYIETPILAIISYFLGISMFGAITQFISLPFSFSMGIIYGWVFNLKKKNNIASEQVILLENYKQTRKSVFFFQLLSALLFGIWIDVRVNLMGVLRYKIPVIGFSIGIPIVVFILLGTIIFCKLKNNILIIFLSTIAGLAAMFLVFSIFGLIVGASTEYGMIYIFGFVPSLVLGFGYGIYLNWYLKDKILHKPT